MTIPRRDAQGCYHPTSEEELCALVADAHATGKQLRVMGSSHTIWHGIVTDNYAGAKTPGTEVMVVLDRYTKVFEAKDDPAHPGRKLVEVQAGCHLGLSPKRPVQMRIVPAPQPSLVHEPSPWHVGTWEASLTSILHHRDKLALPDLGGISHQTVAGFLQTASAGGTLKWSVHEDIAAMRVIDGKGHVHELKPDGADPEWFRAAGIAMGLCGVVSTITFRCEPTFDIVGRETTSLARKTPDCDFYADRPGEQLPSLERFLLDTDYVRMMWWPQHNFDRLVTWQATRAPFDPKREVTPYREMGRLSLATQCAISLIYIFMAYAEDPDELVPELERLRQNLKPADRETLKAMLRRRGPPPDPSQPYPPQEEHPWLSALWEFLKGDRHSPVALGAAWVRMVELLLTGADHVLAALIQLPLFKPVIKKFGQIIPDYIDELYSVFITTGKDGGPAMQHFADRSFMGLAMDNEMDDLILPAWFTEIWVPFTPGDGRVQETIRRLRTYFNADGTPMGAYKATGPFAIELYAAKKDTTFYLSPASESHVFRVDVFWFGKNPTDPVTTFFPGIWKALEPMGFRLHWGKFLTTPDTAPWLTSQLPHWEAWKAVRARVDPGNIFLTKYWKDHLGL